MGRWVGWVYIMTNGPHGMLYIGVTADLAARIYQHRTGKGSEFCRKHKLTRLVYVETYDQIVDAIIREKAMKKWKRAWKLKLVCQANPHWNDLFEHIQDVS
jgi:putative endonuclease